MKVIGIVNSQGEFQGKRYHNLVLQVVLANENENRDVCGEMVDTVKIRYADLNAILDLGLADPADAERIQAEAFADYIGCEISVGYNKYGAVQSLTVTKKPDAKAAEQPKKS